MIEIHIAKDFSRAPAGRSRNDGPRSGEAFRRDYLEPALRKTDRVIVHLDGGEGYGSSFLEEAFGGLVRADRFTADDLHRLLAIETTDEGWKTEIWSYIDQSSSNRASARH